MLQKDNPRLKVYLIMQFFFVLLAVAANAQVYYHNFGTSNINTHPYTVAPTTINPNLSGSSWINSASAWSNQNGATGQAITVQTSGTTTITLSLAVASDFQANITSFNFWNRRSSTGPQNWAMSINGIPVGSGTTSASTSGAAIGVTNVSSPVSGITGTLTVTLTLTGPSGTGGNFRLDDFILNGTVTSTCNAVITSFVPSTGPANTVVTINGNGFTGATAVKFGNTPATAFTVISDTVIEATVPEGAAAGTVGITVNNCSGFSTSSFTPLSSQCGMLGEIFISELYDEGSGQGGMIELYNPTSSPINLDLQDGQPVAYILQRYGDIDDTNPTAGHILQLHGSIAPGATYLVAKIAPNNCTRSISYTISASSNSGFNANDKFELLKNGVLIDVVHVPFQNPGFSIIRKPNAVAPIPVYNNNDWNNSDSESCSDLGRHTINMAPLPVVTQPVSKTICEDGATTFSVAVTPAVGYTYQWKVLNLAGTWVNVANSTNYTGAATNTLSVVDAPAGFNNNQYYCQLTSAMCDIKSNAAQLLVIAPPAVPVATTTSPDCTTPNGTITVSSPTGPGLTYSIDNTTFQAGTTFNGVASGTYTLTVKNAAGCTATTTVIVPVAPNAPATPTFVTQQPDCDTPKGTITFNPQPGVITYSIDGTTFQSSATFTNVDPGTYTPVVKNAAGCTATGAAITINAAPTIPGTPVAATTQPDCTTPSGTITVTSPTGTDFIYSVDGTTFQASPIFNNLSSRSYTVTVKNIAGCTATTTTAINTVPGTPATPVVTPRQPDCNNPKGTITFNTQSGVTYSIDGTTFQNSAIFTNIDSGTYTPVVKNTAGCVASGTPVTINAAPTVPTTPIVDTTQPDCTTPSGTITVTSPTGTDFTYSVDGTTFQASPIFNNLASRSYTVTVKNTAGCTATTTAIINTVPGTPATPVVTLRQPDCNNPKGTITFTAQQGVSYSIDGINFQNLAIFTNVDSGTYTPVVKNSAGCIASGTPVTINAAPTVPNTPVAATTQPDCTTPAGTITVTSPTGTDFTYSVDGTTFQASPIFANLASRSYTLTVKNTAGCTATTRATITPAPAIPAVPVLALTQPNCSNNKGTIRVSSPLGTGLTYSIDGSAFQGSATFTNVDPGSHTITVKNAMGCTAVGAPVTINAAPTVPTTPVVATTQPDCTTNTGTITVTSPTGTDFTYSIDGTTFQASPIFANLASRSYTLTVKNTAGCTATTRVTITAAPAIPTVPVLALTQPDCNNDKGIIRVSAPLGTGLTYSIDGFAFQASVSFTNVDPGNHTITVKNAAGCSTASAAVVIDNPPAPAPDSGTITGITEVCMGETTQLANTVTGGTWTSSNTAIATVDANGLVKTITSGAVLINYTVGTVCTDTASVTLRVNELPRPALSDKYYLCVDNITGAISSKVLNSGLSPALYSFTWKKGNTLLTNTTNTITVNEPGDYTVTATNIATGCSAADTATVSLSSIAVAYAEVGQDFFLNQTITVHITGGSGEYEYQLEDGPFQDTPYFTRIREGEYSITVRDKHECGITELNVFALNYPRFFTPNGDGSHELWNIKSLREQSNARIYIFDRYGKVITTIKPAGLGWDGTYNGARLPATDYWFTVEYMSSNGSQKEFKAHFSLLR
jgi:gliding motility-associated-like protein